MSSQQSTLKEEDNLIFVLSALLLVTGVFFSITLWRLENARKTYRTPEAFEDSCHISTTYIRTAEIIAFVLIIVAIIFMYISASDRYRRNT
jgi:branched-subunit amino acid ABC-type transport system permease component